MRRYAACLKASWRRCGNGTGIADDCCHSTGEAPAEMERAVSREYSSNLFVYSAQCRA
jgi:hypothetical protein